MKAKFIGWTVREDPEHKTVIFYEAEDGTQIEVMFDWDDLMNTTDKWKIMRNIFFRTEAVIVYPKQ